MDLSMISHYKLLLWQGFLVTLQLSVWSIILGTLLGCLIGLARTSHLKIVSGIAKGYIQLFRGAPLLMLLFMFYFGLPYLGQTLFINNPIIVATLQSLSQFFITVLVLTLWASAYIAEIFRSGYQAIPKGQFEAASSLGLSYFYTMIKVILPQMRKIIFPALVGFYIVLIKDTSLASIIGYQELVKQGQTIINITSRPFEIYIVIAIIYFILCYPLSRIVAKAERRLVA